MAASVKPHQGESGPPGDVVWMAARWCRPPLWWMVLALWACDVAENRTTRGGVGRLVLITTCFVVFYFFTLISPAIPFTHAIFQPTRAILHPSRAGLGRLSAKLGRYALRFERSLLSHASGLQACATFSPMFAPCSLVFARVGGKVARVGWKVTRLSAVIARDSWMVAPSFATFARHASATLPLFAMLARAGEPAGGDPRDRRPGPGQRCRDLPDALPRGELPGFDALGHGQADVWQPDVPAPLPPHRAAGLRSDPDLSRQRPRGEGRGDARRQPDLRAPSPTPSPRSARYSKGCPERQGGRRSAGWWACRPQPPAALKPGWRKYLA